MVPTFSLALVGYSSQKEETTIEFAQSLLSFNPTTNTEAMRKQKTKIHEIPL